MVGLARRQCDEYPKRRVNVVWGGSRGNKVETRRNGVEQDANRPAGSPARENLSSSLKSKPEYAIITGCILEKPGNSCVNGVLPEQKRG